MKKNLRLVAFLVVALAQLAVPSYAMWMRSQTLQHGRIWKFQTKPVDPADAFRGRYVLLGFAADQVPQTERISSSEDDAYAVLKEGSSGFAEIDRVSATPLQGDNVIKVRPTGWWDGQQHVAFPFDRMWLNEKIAPEAERAYWANSNRQKQNAYVTVRVRSGDAALEELFLDGKPLKEYLRESK